MGKAKETEKRRDVCDLVCSDENLRLHVCICVEASICFKHNQIVTKLEFPDRFVPVENLNEFVKAKEISSAQGVSFLDCPILLCQPSICVSIQRVSSTSSVAWNTEGYV